MTKSSFYSNGRASQAHDEDVDLDTASFDGDDFAELGMEFGNEDIRNTFLEDTESPPAAALARSNNKKDPQGTVQEQPTSSTTTASASSSSPLPKDDKKKDAPIKGPSRRRKRPKGKPRRPLCGYNIFFQRHSKEIQATTPFKDLGRIMGERWKGLSEEERAVYEKEAEKDVIRFRREMDIYEKKRRERLCPSPKSSLSNGMNSFYSNPGTVTSAAAELKPPPGWSATNVSSLLGGFASAEPHANSSIDMFASNQGPPALPSTGLHVPGQFLGSPPPTMALPQGTEISLPDATGMARKYRVVYACYRMTQTEANDYMARFAALTAGWHPSVAAPTPPPPPPAPAAQHAMHPPPSPHTFPQVVPAQSPQLSRPTYSHPPPPPTPPPPPHSPHPSPHAQHHIIHHVQAHSPHAPPRLPFTIAGTPHTMPWPN